MAVEKMEAQIVGSVDKQSLITALGEVEKFARDTGKKLDKDTVLNYRIDSAKLKMELEKVRGQLAQAKKDGDKESIFNLTAKSTKLQSDLTQANRLLNNYVNTGNATLSRLQSKFDGITSLIKGQFMGALTAVGAYITGNMIGDMIRLAGTLEQTKIAFTTMLGSEQEAVKLLDELNQYGKTTPFEVTQLREYAKNLMAVNVETKNIIPVMDMLGNVASGLGGPDVFGRLVYAFGQVKAAGKLTGNELRQFTETGVPLLDTLAKQFGVTTGAIKDMVSNGEIGFNDIVKAFQTMTAEGGKFHGLMNAQSTTLLGTWSNLKDSTNLLAEKMGTALIPTMKRIIVVLQAIAQSVPLVASAFNYGITWISNKILGFVYGIQVSSKAITSAFFMAVNTVSGYLSDLGTNIWRTFASIPQAIKINLNEAIKSIEDFLNKAINGINKFANLLGIDKKIGGVSLGRISVGTSIGQTTAGRDSAKIRNDQIKNDFKMYAEQKALAQSFNNDRLDMSFDAMNKEFMQFGVTKKAEIDTEYDGEDAKVEKDKETNKAKGKSAEELAEEKKKLAEKELKEQLEMDARYEKFKRDMEEKRFEQKKKLLEGINKNLDEEVKKSEKIIDGLNDQLKELEKIDDINGRIAKRYVDIGEKIDATKEKIIDVGDEDKRKLYDNLLNEIPKETLDKLGKDDGLAGGVTVDELREYAKLKKELADLQKEEALAKANTSQAKIDEENLTDTEKLILERKAIEDKLGLQTYQYDTEKANIEKRISDNQGLIESYQAVQETIEKKITGVLDEETQKRVKIIERETAALLKLIALRNQNSGNTASSNKVSSTTNVANTTNNNGNTNINVTDQASASKVIKMITTVLNSNSKGIK